MDEPNDSGALDRLGDLLADPQTRKDFFIDPGGALEAAEIDPSGIPGAFLDALKELDYGELGTLSRINRKLTDAGLVGANILKWPV